MAGLKEFKNEIIRNTLLTALVIQMISLPVIGICLPFTCALVFGTLITVFNFILLVSAGEKVVNAKSSGPMVGSYFLRLAIYGAGFFAAIKFFGLYAAAGCAAGYLSLHLAILFTYLIIYGLFKKKKNPLNDWTEPKEWNDLSIYDEEDDWNN